MARSPGGAVMSSGSVESFFQLSLLGLLASGYLAVAGSGVLDSFTIAVVGAGLVLRTLAVAGLVRVHLTDRQVTALTVAYALFYPIDYFWLTKTFIPATVHLVFFLAVVKLLTARTERDYFYLKIIAFMELLGAALLSSNLSFFIFLASFLIFGVATFASGEIRRGTLKVARVARSSHRYFHGRLSALTVFTSAGILLLTACLFFLLPRTARAALRRWVPTQYHLTGFSNEVLLGQLGELKQQNTAVMHVRFFGPEQQAGRRYRVRWRGTALTFFDGRRWYNEPRRDEALKVEDGQVRLNADLGRPRFGDYVGYQVQLNPIGADAIFLAGTPEFLQIPTPVVFRTSVDGYRLGFANTEPVRYGAYSFLGEPGPDQIRNLGLVRPASPSGTERNAYLQLPSLDPRVPHLAAEVMGRQRNDYERARVLEQYLKTKFTYTTDMLSSPVDDPLAHFLFQRRKGHCEYFSSAMAVLLRTQGIPSRVVTGFQSGVYNPLTGWQLIRASDAHSWVEAWLPDQGWITFDPTPPDPNAGQTNLLSRLSLFMDAADVFWQDWVLNYDIDRQFTLMSHFEESRRRFNGNWFRDLQDTATQWTESAGRWFRENGAILVTLIALAVAAWLGGPRLWSWVVARIRAKRVLRGQASASDATLLYMRMLDLLKRRGIEKPGWITPGEFLRQLPASPATPLIEDITGAYNDVRFGGRQEAAPRMVELLIALEHALPRHLETTTPRQS